jgi:hypothetical protein
MAEDVRRCDVGWADCVVSSLVGEPGELEGKRVVQEERSMLVDQIK